MKKRFTTTGIALLVFCALFFYANVYEVDVIPEPGKDKPVQLAATANTEVKAITWHAGTPAEIRVQSEASGTEKIWKIVKPAVYKADRDTVSSIIQTFSDLQSELTITADDPTSYGIGSDAPRLTLETASGTATLALGSDTPVGGSVYVKKDGDSHIYVAPNIISSAFQKTLDDLRDKSIFFPEESFTDVASLSIITASETIELSKTATGWEILAPRKVPADAAAVSSLIFGLHDLKADRFFERKSVENDDLGFAKPSCKFVLHTTSGASYELSIGREEGYMTLVRRSGSDEVFMVSTSRLAPYLKDFNDLRSKELPPILPFEVKKLELRIGSEAFTLTLASDTWKCGDRTLEKNMIEDVLRGYSSARIQEFMPPTEAKTAGLDVEADCDRIVLTSDKVSRKLLFGKHLDSSVAVSVDGENEIYKISDALYNAVKNLAAELRKKPQASTENAAASGTANIVASSVPLASQTATDSMNASGGLSVATHSTHIASMTKE